MADDDVKQHKSIVYDKKKVMYIDTCHIISHEMKLKK